MTDVTFRHYCVLAHYVFDGLGDQARPSDVIDEVKWACAAADFPYRSDIVRAAVDAVQAVRQQGYRTPRLVQGRRWS